MEIDLFDASFLAWDPNGAWGVFLDPAKFAALKFFKFYFNRMDGETA
jgi:hypothetical protein